MLEKSILTIQEPQVSFDALCKAVRMDEDADPDDRAELRRMLEEALAAAKPKALYGVAQIETIDANGVTACGVRFRSALAAQNLRGTRRIIPFAATCGTEAEEWSLQYAGDPLAAYWADAIKLQLLGLVRKKLSDEVRRRYFAEGDLSAMSPGSLAAWPLTEQRALFSLLGGVTQDIGVRLTESCLMLPSKSSSGFFFSAGSHYENCRYCPLLRCPNRRAEFERELDPAR